MISASPCTDNPQIAPTNNLIKDRHSSDFSPVNKKNFISTATINFQSVTAKQAQFQCFINDYYPDIIFGTETWLSPEISSSEIFPPCYNVFRRDRYDGYGGILLAFDHSLMLKNTR